MRARSWLCALAVGLGAVAPVAGPVTSACAAGTPRAVLVVDTGPVTHRFCVELDDDAVSGLELIKLANAQYGLHYQFGHGGKAVCVLDHVGSASENCLNEDAFWAYWRADDEGNWSTQSQGAGSAVVRNGDVDGWSYGEGRGASNHQKPGSGEAGERITFGSVCAKVDDDPGDGTDPGGGDGPGAGGTPDPSASPSVSPTPNKKKNGPSPGASPKADDRRLDSAPDVSELTLTPTPGATPAPSVSGLPAGALSEEEQQEEESGLPLAGVLAGAAALAMAGVAFFVLRKRASS